MAKERDSSANLCDVRKDAPSIEPKSSVGKSILEEDTPDNERTSLVQVVEPGCSNVRDTEELTEELDSKSSSSPEVLSDFDEVKEGKTEGEDHGPDSSSGDLKTKHFPLPLSPERGLSAKRCLWEVDRREVDESLSKEMKRIRQDEALVKSAKWNFDFEKEIPLSGTWRWEAARETPAFYQGKELSESQKKCKRKVQPSAPPTPAKVPATVSSSTSPVCLDCKETSSRLVTTISSPCTSSSTQSVSRPADTLSSPISTSKDICSTRLSEKNDHQIGRIGQ